MKDCEYDWKDLHLRWARTQDSQINRAAVNLLSYWASVSDKKGNSFMIKKLKHGCVVARGYF